MCSSHSTDASDPGVHSLGLSLRVLLSLGEEEVHLVVLRVVVIGDHRRLDELGLWGGGGHRSVARRDRGPTTLFCLIKIRFNK